MQGLCHQRFAMFVRKPKALSSPKRINLSTTKLNPQPQTPNPIPWTLTLKPSPSRFEKYVLGKDVEIDWTGL